MTSTFLDILTKSCPMPSAGADAAYPKISTDTRTPSGASSAFAYFTKLEMISTRESLVLVYLSVSARFSNPSGKRT